MTATAISSKVKIPAGNVMLEGNLVIPGHAEGVILFAHGSGRLSPRNIFVSKYMEKSGFGTLLFDLLTRAEERDFAIT